MIMPPSWIFLIIPKGWGKVLISWPRRVLSAPTRLLWYILLIESRLPHMLVPFCWNLYKNWLCWIQSSWSERGPDWGLQIWSNIGCQRNCPYVKRTLMTRSLLSPVLIWPLYTKIVIFLNLTWWLFFMIYPKTKVMMFDISPTCLPQVCSEFAVQIFYFFYLLCLSKKSLLQAFLSMWNFVFRDCLHEPVWRTLYRDLCAAPNCVFPSDHCPRKARTSLDLTKYCFPKISLFPKSFFVWTPK